MEPDNVKSTDPAVLNLAKPKPAKPAKTAKSNGKEAKTAKTTKGGMTTREAAKMLKTTPKALRRALRDMDKYDDGIYTRYTLGKADINALAKSLSA